MDIVYVLLGAGFFAVTGWMVRGFSRLAGQ